MSTHILSTAFISYGSPNNSSTHSHAKPSAYTLDVSNCCVQAVDPHHPPSAIQVPSIYQHSPIMTPPLVYTSSQPSILEVPSHPLPDHPISTEPPYPLHSRFCSQGLDAIVFHIDSTPYLPKPPRGCPSFLSKSKHQVGDAFLE